MLAFALPPLALVTATGFVTRALANWAAPAFISAAVVVLAILVRRGAWKWIALSLAIGVFVQAALVAGDARGDPAQCTLARERRRLSSHARLARARRAGGSTRPPRRRPHDRRRRARRRGVACLLLARPAGAGAVPGRAHLCQTTSSISPGRSPTDTPLPILFVSHCASAAGSRRSSKGSSRSAASRLRPGRRRREPTSRSSSTDGAHRCGRLGAADRRGECAACLCRHTLLFFDSRSAGTALLLITNFFRDCPVGAAATPADSAVILQS